MAATLFDYFQAIRDDQGDEVKTYLSSGAWPVDFQNTFGQTALHVATIHNQPSIIKILLAQAARLDLQDEQGHTPLHIACRNAHYGPEYLDTVRLLISLGADPTIRSEPTDAEISEVPSFAAGRLPIDCVHPDVREQVAVLMNEAAVSVADTVESGPPCQPDARPENESAGPTLLQLDSLPVGAMMFVGQGTQFVGMARDILERDGPGRAVFTQASALLGYDLAALCLGGPADKLNSTAFSQPAVMVSSLAALAELRESTPQAVEGIGHWAGFSLGELTALVAAGFLSFEDGLQLVKVRAEAMQAAAEEHPGTMGSVVGLGDEALATLVAEARAEAGGVLEVANYLFPNGRSISGSHEAVTLALQKATELKALSAKPLVVGGAFHTSCMLPAREALRQALEKITFKPANQAVYSNVTGRPYTSVEEIRERLLEQVVCPVQWETIARTLAQLGGPVYEVGAGDQLKAMMRRIDMAAWQRVQGVGQWKPPRG